LYFTSPGTGGVNHPFHLHGYYFYVIAMGTFEKGQTEDDIIEGFQRGTFEISKTPPYRDTIAVPAAGYTVIRIHARNPGKFKKFIITIATQSSSSSIELSWPVLALFN
jgi:FtsP/CotA-like multicopper oxidase with cupredoxin domain